MKEIKLREIAFSRSGDKADTNNVCVVPYNGEDYEMLLKKLTVAKVKKAYGPVVKGTIARYEYPGAKILNFVMKSALWGGVSTSLCQDMWGKARGGVMLNIDISVPDDYVPPRKVGNHVEWKR